MPPLVSIVIPTFNDELYLGETISSASEQTYEQIEIIVVDDGSTDGSAAIYQQMAKNDSRIRVIWQENAGLSAARNAGINQARGEFIAFLDSDDLLHPDFIKIMLNALIKSETDVAVCESVVFPDGAHSPFHAAESAALENGELLSQDKSIRELLLGNIIANVWNRLYRRSTLKDVQFKPGIYFEDLEFTAQLFLKTNGCTRLTQALHAYRKRRGSILSTPKQKLLDDRIIVVRQVLQTFAAAGRDSEFSYELKSMALLHLAYYGMKDYVRIPNPDPDWIKKMHTCLTIDFELNLLKFFRLKLIKKARKWAAIALMPLPVIALHLSFHRRRDGNFQR